jgi:hypothetical protein
LNTVGNYLDVILDLYNQLLDVACALFAGLRQSSHLVGDDSKAPAVLAGACSLDGGVKRQQIGLPSGSDVWTEEIHSHLRPSLCG